MTEEEIAEEYVDTLLDKDDTELDKFLDENLVGLKLNEKQAGTILGVIKGVGLCSFLAGLKAGKPQWHKVKSGDLPPEDTKVLAFMAGGEVCIAHFYRKNVWDKIGIVIAWCEIPQCKD